MVDACEDEQTALLKQYVLSRQDELALLKDVEDSAAGPLSVSPFVPCAPQRIPYILQAARLTASDVLWDLGCGDGAVLVAAAQRCGCRCVGLDIDAECLAAARRRAAKANVAELCTWRQGDLLALPLGTLAKEPRATAALCFLTAHGLKRLAPWLHKEWQAMRLRLITCVESLDSAMDFTQPDALFGEDELHWPVCRGLERWGVFVVPPYGEEESWTSSAWPLTLTRAEAEATRAQRLQLSIDLERLSRLGHELLRAAAEKDDLDLFATAEESFHKAAEQALHTSGPHRVLYLHAEEVRQQLGADRSFLEEVEAEIVARMREEDGKRWGLLSHRSVAVRSMEYHAYSDGGSVMDPEHRDDGSLLTLSLLLSKPELFEGGVFSTFEQGERVEHPLSQGEAVIFLSEKRHNVSPVVGERHALVLELWEGARNRVGRHD